MIDYKFKFRPNAKTLLIGYAVPIEPEPPCGVLIPKYASGSMTDVSLVNVNRFSPLTYTRTFCRCILWVSLEGIV